MYICKHRIILIVEDPFDSLFLILSSRIKSNLPHHTFNVFCESIKSPSPIQEDDLYSSSGALFQNIPQKMNIKNVIKQILTIYTHYIYIIILYTKFQHPQHNGRHVTTSHTTLAHHKGKIAKIGRADAEVKECIVFFKSILEK